MSQSTRKTSEKFRKTRENNFRRGLEIAAQGDAYYYAVFIKKGKTYMCSSTKDMSIHDIENNLVIYKTSADYKTSKKSKTALSTLGIQVPKLAPLEKASSVQLQNLTTLFNLAEGSGSVLTRDKTGKDK